MTIQMFPPGDGKHNTITVNGRSYTCAPGSVIAVPDQDAKVMEANGWTLSIPGGSLTGTTAQRPAKPNPGVTYIDTTINAVIRWDALGKVWVNALTGAAV